MQILEKISYNSGSLVRVNKSRYTRQYGISKQFFKSYILIIISLFYLFVPTALFAEPCSGNILSDTTWTGNVDIEGDVVVQCGAVLTIQPGTNIRFSANSSTFDDSLGNDGLCDLIVLGGIKAVGGHSAADSIVFTSNSMSPAPGNWGIILFMPIAVDSLCQLDYTSISFGTIGLKIIGSIDLEHTRFSDNSSHGLYWSDNAFPILIDDMVFESNGGNGCRIDGIDSIDISNSYFDNNVNSGLFVTGT